MRNWQDMQIGKSKNIAMVTDLKLDHKESKFNFQDFMREPEPE